MVASISLRLCQCNDHSKKMREGKLSYIVSKKENWEKLEHVEFSLDLFVQGQTQIK